MVNLSDYWFEMALIALFLTGFCGLVIAVKNWLADIQGNDY